MKMRKFLIISAFLLLFIGAILYINWDRPLGEIETVMLDPGHGATDVGCSYGGVNEKDINYDIALRTKEWLEVLGYKVVLTHNDKGYIDPRSRAQFANSKGVDLYISIHQNATENEDACGIETWYSLRNPHSRRLAECIQSALIGDTQREDRGVKLTSSLIVVRETKMPSVLIECGFLSNPDERDLLDDGNYRQAIATSIAHAVDDFAKN